jgi:hypothetical protein
MRVEAVEKFSQPAGNVAARADASAGLAAKNFAAAMGSDDSLFTLLEPLAGHIAQETADGRVAFGDVVLGFKEAGHARQKSLKFLLVEKLIELLKEAGSKETLEAKLCLDNDTPGAGNQNALCVRLAAKGDSEEQAWLRWGLGLTHLQQALLFTSRHLRQHLKQARE